MRLNIEEALQLIQSGQATQGLMLDLAYNQISNDGVQALAMALQSGKAPQGLTLDLGDNNIKDAGERAIATALQSEKMPQGLTLELTLNDIGTNTQALASAYAYQNKLYQ
ncbi:Ran GTPase-activating protein (RanGAP) involved in mRNA processing and transport [Legionella busanensis]|uniref:Ran GTPase-activating protein (RanGAP) involved in mRNA processing and transport n=1 Tax=Legionella busanensis TaxID=190655 RepID=A0A378KD36_9GAMM|nr:hypothetical protein [Legionella busanensis]STX81421.1 Ran GTPase-activating protein (RanGAP) involved in mRNA processing and transport [Legionella busanensis]